MDETLIGTVPTTPMTRTQRALHKRMARTEQRLIHAIMWDEPEEKIGRLERRCNTLASAWKAVTR
jgi:hypothetical protein